jgi:hypothetical protein
VELHTLLNVGSVKHLDFKMRGAPLPFSIQMALALTPLSRVVIIFLGEALVAIGKSLEPGGHNVVEHVPVQL